MENGKVIGGGEGLFGAPSAEKLPGSFETGEKSTRAGDLGEAAPTAEMPAGAVVPMGLPPEMEQEATGANVVENTYPEVGRDAETLSKQFADKLIGDMKAVENDPYAEAAVMDKAKTTYLDKAFKRTRGKEHIIGSKAHE